MPPKVIRAQNESDLQAKIKAEVDAVLERTLQSEAFLKSLAATLTDIVAKKLEESMSFNENLISALQKKIEDRDREIQNLKEELDLKTDQLEMYSRRNCLRIFGLAEEEGENTDEKVIAVARKISVDLSINDIDRSHRVGRKIDGKSRPVIVKFVSYRKRREVFQSKRKLKGQNITIREDLTRQRLEVLRAAISRFQQRNVWTEDGQVVVNTGSGRFRLQTMSDLSHLK